MRALFQTLILICVLVSCQENSKKRPTQTELLILKIDSILENSAFNGIVLLAKDTFILYNKVQGYADFERKISIKKSDAFVIGSISKQITAILILQQLEKDKLKLDDKISLYLPEIDQSWANEITIHHLLTHTHGIQSVDEPLEFQPGSQFQYSQLGYQLLAEILEQLHHKSFRDISNELFTQHHLQHLNHPADSVNFVKGYIEDGTGNKTVATNSLYNFPAAGSFIGDAKSVMLWNHLLHSNQLLSSKTTEKMKTRYATRQHPIFGSIEYGYGLLFQKNSADLEIGALGYAPGFVSASYYYPKSHLNLIVLENIARTSESFSEAFKIHLAIMNEVSNHDR